MIFLFLCVFRKKINRKFFTYFTSHPSTCKLRILYRNSMLNLCLCVIVIHSNEYDFRLEIQRAVGAQQRAMTKRWKYGDLSRISRFAPKH